jgi:hypothetical protein
MSADDDPNVRRLADEMLCAAYELVLSGWSQHASARDAAGNEVEPSSALARSWSATGALERVWRRGDPDPDRLAAFMRANLALAAVVSDLPKVWNDADGRTLRQILDAIAEAADTTRRPDTLT